MRTAVTTAPHFGTAPVLYPLNGKRVWVAGHRGMVGAALVRRLRREGCDILTVPREALDLTRQERVEAWVGRTRPDAVLVPAARVGGILANDTRPAAFLYENLMIAANIVHAACRVGVEKLLFLGSSCIYPRDAPQPMTEEALLTGPLEPTNQWYAVAKLAGLKLCQAYRREHGCDVITALPTNLYGPGDNFDPGTAHVLPAMLRRAHEAKRRGARGLTIWGTGRPRREFLHVDDCADALVLLMTRYSGESPVNVGSGREVTIEALARLIMEVVGLEGPLEHDLFKPDGAPRKLLDSTKLAALGWRPSIPLERGVRELYREMAPVLDRMN
jgi:GDP-L-fucose synthase